MRAWSTAVFFALVRALALTHTISAAHMRAADASTLTPALPCMFQAATTHSAPVATNGRALSTNDPVKSGAYGGDGGDAFDDYNTLGPSSLGVSSIQVWSGNAIDRLVITYKDGHEVTHGDNSGGSASETFNVGSSYITKVSIRSGNVVDQLQFELADGRKSAVYGGNGGDAHSCQAPEGTAIVSFFGGAGNSLDQIGCYTIPTCSDIGSVTGKWVADVYTDGDATIEQMFGTASSTTYTRDESWSDSVTNTLSGGFEFEGSSSSVQVSSTVASGLSESYTNAFEQTYTTSQTVSWSEPGQVWRWEFDTADSCGDAQTFKDYVTTNDVDHEPCCPPGFALNPSEQHGPCTQVELCTCDVDTCTSGTA